MQGCRDAGRGGGLNSRPWGRNDAGKQASLCAVHSQSHGTLDVSATTSSVGCLR